MNSLALQRRRFVPSSHRRGAVLMVAAAATMMLPMLASGMTACPSFFQEIQPENGDVIELQLHGDEYQSWMTDSDGFTVLRDEATGNYFYAEPNDETGDLKVSSELVVHPMRKFSKKSKASILNKKPSSKKQKNLRPKKRDCKNKLCGDLNESERRLRGASSRSLQKDYLPYPGPFNTTLSDEEDGVRRQLNPNPSGTLRNLVVLLRWSDHVNRTLPSREDVSILMNHKGPHVLCPSGSVRDVFLENSYGALNLESVVADWVTVDNTEKFYANGGHGVTKVIWGAVRNILQQLDDKDEVDFKYFDQNNDNKIDSITFLHSGYAAEFGGKDTYGQFYLDRIWSHQWALNDGAFVTKSGVSIREYHISPALWGRSGAGIGRIGVIAHETGHFLGLPDLYDTNGGGRGIGYFGLMANSWGWDGSQYWPPHLSGWAKFVLGWMPATVPVEGLNQVEATENHFPDAPQLYIIQEGFPEGEFLLIENRQRKGYDKNIPQGGILIWHIDNGNNKAAFRNSLRNEGFPGQPGWPENGNHYGVALLQADGQYDLEKGHNHGDREDVFHALGVDELLPCLDLSACQYPNTDSYKNGVIARSNVAIYDISQSSDVMTFKYYHGEDFIESEAPSSSPSLAPTLGGPCKADETHFELDFKTDYYAEDNSWSIVHDETGEIVAQQGDFGRNTLYKEELCLASGHDYTFELLDSWGDSICCAYGEGYYAIRLDGIELFRGGDNVKFGVKHTFHTSPGGITAPTTFAPTTASPTKTPTTAPSSAPSLFPSESPSTAPSSAPTLCTCVR